MTSTSSLDQHAFWKENKSHYHEQLNKVYDPIFAQFDRLMKKQAAFNLFFITLCSAEIILLGMFFTFFAQSMLLALMLAVVFFTCFAYFTLRLYFQTKMPEEIKEIKERYVNACKGLLNYQETPEHYIALANACCKLANRLHGREYTYYAFPSWFSSMGPIMEKFSCRCHWQDVHHIKELLLQASVNEHLKLIKCQPINLEAHAALANAYVMLSGLYIDPRKIERYDEERWIPPEKYNRNFEEKFRSNAECAIEEFKILNEYAPDDPWVHSQLAYSYHDLQMPLEEIKEYETIYKINPDDQENLYKLGILYFQQGLNARGLRVYEELKKSQYQKAENLIRHYGEK